MSPGTCTYSTCTCGSSPRLFRQEFGNVGCMGCLPIARPIRSPPSPLLAHTLSLPMPFSPSDMGPASVAELRPTSAPALCSLICSPVTADNLQRAAAAVQNNFISSAVALGGMVAKRLMYAQSVLRITCVILNAVTVCQLNQLKTIVQEGFAVANVCYCQQVSGQNGNCEGCACGHHRQHLGVMTVHMMQPNHTDLMFNRHGGKSAHQRSSWSAQNAPLVLQTFRLLPA